MGGGVTISVGGVPDGLLLKSLVASLARIWAEGSTIHFSSAVFFFFVVEISLRLLILLSRQG